MSHGVLFCYYYKKTVQSFHLTKYLFIFEIGILHL